MNLRPDEASAKPRLVFSLDARHMFSLRFVIRHMIRYGHWTEPSTLKSEFSSFWETQGFLSSFQDLSKHSQESSSDFEAALKSLVRMAANITDQAEFAATHEIAYEEADFKKEHPEVSDVSSNEHLDGIHDGLEFPTEEERLTLRRVADAVPWNAYFIAVVEMAERFSYYGTSVVFTNFIQQPLPDGSRTGAAGLDGQAGALGKGQRASTGLTTFYSFWAYVTPLLGGYIADAHLGRFKTVSVGIGIAMLGHIVIIISAIPGVIEKPGAIGCFVIGIIITGSGTGLFKSNISPLIAEQYKRTKLFVITLDSGERVIVDPVYTTTRIYMYFYLFTNIGSLIGQITMTYAEKFVGFWLAFMLPTIVFLLCPLVLYARRRHYVRSKPNGSILLTAIRLFRFASKGRWSLNPVRTYKNLRADDFWENAKPSKQTGELPKWMTFDDQWVDEVRRGIKACGVFVWYPIYWLTYGQLNNNLTSQAATMETHGVPNDILSNLNPFALTIIIPILDLLVYPWMRRVGIRFTALKRITSGFFIGSMAMVWAAVVQYYIYKTNPCGRFANDCKVNGERAVSPINVWSQTGSYVLIAISEIFANITGLEYAFTKAPKNMRSLVMALYLFTNAVGSALSEAFLPLVEDPLLIWNYTVVGCLAFVTCIVFWWTVRDLDSREDELNNLAEGHVGADVAVPVNEKSEKA
uniref:Putative peptide transporter PTR2A n=1 Tax=Moniliophthora roreri TaxID=221103 RepID=A0A0W0FSY4_MONRR